MTVVIYVFLKPLCSSKEYWDWSWDELAEYDLPATVEYVYGHTGKQKLHYVGHSLVSFSSTVGMTVLEP